MPFDPAHGPVQQERLGFGILRKWNPARDKPTGGFQRILSGNEEQRTDLYWRFSRVVDIPDQQSLGDKVHDGLSISGALATSRRNLAPVPLRSLPCERYTSHTIPPTSAQGTPRCPVRPLKKLKPGLKPFSAPFVRGQALGSINGLRRRMVNGVASVRNATTVSPSIRIWSSTCAPNRISPTASKRCPVRPAITKV